MATAQQFNSWFPLLGPSLANISTNTCADSLSAFRFDPTRISCQSHINCILPNVLDIDKADMTNASILLGILPVFVATFGPDVKEIALLSLRWPLLGLLLSIGVPAVYISRPMEYADPLELLEPAPGRFIVQRVKSWRMAVLLSGAEYSIVAMAIVNLLWVSYTLGIKAVLAWRCIPFMPVAWVLMPVIIHLIAVIAFRTSKAVRHSALKNRDQRGLRHWARTECMLSANHDEWILADEAPGYVTVSVNFLATLTGSIHVIFGIVVFASLLFISLLDAILVCNRYLASIIVCRLVLKFEIAGARGTFKLENHDENRDLVTDESSTNLMGLSFSHYKRPRAWTREASQFCHRFGSRHNTA